MHLLVMKLHKVDLLENKELLFSKNNLGKYFEQEVLAVLEGYIKGKLKISIVILSFFQKMVNKTIIWKHHTHSTAVFVLRLLSSHHFIQPVLLSRIFILFRNPILGLWTNSREESNRKADQGQQTPTTAGLPMTLMMELLMDRLKIYLPQAP